MLLLLHKAKREPQRKRRTLNRPTSQETRPDRTNRHLRAATRVRSRQHLPTDLHGHLSQMARGHTHPQQESRNHQQGNLRQNHLRARSSHHDPLRSRKRTHRRCCETNVRLIRRPQNRDRWLQLQGERMCRDRWLGSSLCILRNRKTGDWESYVPPILFAYKASTNDATGYSPFELNHGRLPQLPFNAMFAHELPKDKTQGALRRLSLAS